MTRTGTYVLTAIAAVLYIVFMQFLGGGFFGPPLWDIEPPHRRVTDGEHGKHGQRTTQDRDRGLVSKPRPFIRACAAVSTHVRTLPPTTSGLSRHSLPQTLSTFHPLEQESNVDYAGRTSVIPHNHRTATLLLGPGEGFHHRKDSRPHRTRACVRGGRADT